MIPAATTMGAVELTVADLERSLAYYTRQIGLEVVDRDGGRASLGAGGGGTLVELVEEPGARPADGYAGLFHFALRVPQRVDLARWLAHAARDGVALTGASDHFVSEALYLRDPDHHGIEIYWDRPRELWEGRVDRMTTLPLDVQDLLAEVDDDEFDGLPGATDMGHVHLRVADVDDAVRFYGDALGFELMVRFGAQAAFLSAGGYHHHVGANTWESRGAPPAPEGTARLRRATVVLPDAAERDRLTSALPHEDTDAGPLVRDPSGNGIVLAVVQ